MRAPQPLGTQEGMGVEGIRAQEAAASALQVCREERKGEGREEDKQKDRVKGWRRPPATLNPCNAPNFPFSLVPGLLQKLSPVLRKKRYKRDV